MYAKKTDLRRAALLHARAADADAAAPPMTPRARAVTARAYSSSSHWLPSRARSWLDDIENAAFTKTLKAQLDLVPALAGRGDAIAAKNEAAGEIDVESNLWNNLKKLSDEFKAK